MIIRDSYQFYSSAGITNVWDGFGRLASSATNMDGVSRSMTSQYDADGNRILLTGDQGYPAPFGYDGLGRMSAYANLVQFGYDAAGRRSSLSMGPGWTSSTTGYAYDPAGRLQSLTHNLAGTSGDQATGLGYNPASQIVTRTGSNDAYAWTGSVAVNRPYSVNGQNQYLAAGPASFAYDPNGNLTSDGSTTFVYDVENRLVSASGAKTATLVYDPLGRLFQTSGGAAGVTQFLYDDDALIGEYDTSGYMLRRYIHGADKGTDDPLIWYENAASGWRRALAADQQGSVIAVADMYGNPIAINTYDEYGIPGANNQGRFQYTGQAWIAELGMYYYKARIYSPTLGRFLQVDPIGYDDQINLYAYVGNDPVNMTDPSGLDGGCSYGPSKCGARQVTAAEQESGEQTAAVLGSIGMAIFPAARALGAASKGWTAYRAWRLANAVKATSAAARAFKAAAAQAGTTTAGVGKMVGWGGGPSAVAQAVARTAQIDKAAVAAMREAGLTRTLAKSARDFYKAAARTEGLKGGSVAPQRARLMERVLSNW